MKERDGDMTVISTSLIRSRRGLLVGCALFMPVLFLTTFQARAAQIVLGSQNGVYNVSNINGQLVGVSSVCINWDASLPCSPSTSAGDQGSGDPLDFSVATGSIKDLMQGEPFPVVQFETAPGTGGNIGATQVNFDLIQLVTPTVMSNDCTSGNVGSTCAPMNSPFMLTQVTANQVSITLTALLEAYTGSSGTNYSAATQYNAIFTTQISGCINNSPTCANGSDTIPNILAYLGASQSNFVDATWSATESPVAAPEPVSWLLMGSGLMAAGIFGRRFRKS